MKFSRYYNVLSRVECVYFSSKRHVLQHLLPGDVVYIMICFALWKFRSSVYKGLVYTPFRKKLGSKSSGLLCWSHSQKEIDAGALYALFQLDYTP